MAAALGKPLDKRQYAHMAKIYKEFPGGVEALMAAVCFVAIKEPKGDPMVYLGQISEKKRRGRQAPEPREKGFRRDDYVES